MELNGGTSIMAEVRRMKRELPGLKREEVEGFFVFEDGFHTVDWNAASAWVSSKFAGEEVEDAMRWVVQEWVERLRQDIGGDYHITEGNDVVLLSDRSAHGARWLAGYAERALRTIHEELGSATWGHLHPLIVFSEEDDYYQYISRFSAEGEQAQSGGIFIGTGYPHIALVSRDANDAASGIVHELTHHCLDHYNLPLWVNEAVAMTLQRQIAPPNYGMGGDQEAVWGAISSWSPPMLWDELAERHFAFWNAETIQAFWAGTSFYEPGDSNELSYNLAEIFLTLLREGKEKALLAAFLELARPEDAGHDAAHRIFHKGLDEIAGTFLGPGNWRPDRKVIAECWRAAGWGPAP